MGYYSDKVVAFRSSGQSDDDIRSAFELKFPKAVNFKDQPLEDLAAAIDIKYPKQEAQATPSSVGRSSAFAPETPEAQPEAPAPQPAAAGFGELREQEAKMGPVESPVQEQKPEVIPMTVGPQQDVIGHQSFRKPAGASRDIPDPETVLDKIVKPLKAFAIMGADLTAAPFKAAARRQQKDRTKYNPLTGDIEPIVSKEEKEVFKPKTVSEMDDEEIDRYLAKKPGEKIADWIEGKIDPEWRKDVANVKSLTQSIKDLDLPGGAESAATAIGQQSAIIGTMAAEAAIPFAGPAIGAAHMIALETKGFLDNADRIAEQIPDKRLKAEWKMASDKAASRYGVTAGIVEYAGNLLGMGKYMPGGTGKTVSKAVSNKAVRVITGILGEPLEEVTQAADQNWMMQQAIDEVKKKHPNFNPEWQKESLLESALQALVVSSAQQAGGKVAQKISQKLQKPKTVTVEGKPYEEQPDGTLKPKVETLPGQPADGSTSVMPEEGQPQAPGAPISEIADEQAADKAGAALEALEPTAQEIADQPLEGIEDIPEGTPAEPVKPTKTPTQAKAPIEIVRPDIAVDEELKTTTDKRTRELLEEKKEAMGDDLFNEPGANAYSLKEGQRAIKKMEAANIPYSVVRMDIEGMNTANSHFGSHAKADVAMRAVLGQNVIKDLNDAGAIVFKGNKADEIRAAVPNSSVEAVEAILEKAQDKGVEARDKLGIGQLTHIKYKLENYGALDFTYSVVEGQPGKYGEMDRQADELEGAMKAIKLDIAEKNPILRGKELNNVIRKLVRETRVAGTDLTARRPGTPVEESRIADGEKPGEKVSAKPVQPAAQEVAPPKPAQPAPEKAKAPVKQAVPTPPKATPAPITTPQPTAKAESVKPTDVKIGKTIPRDGKPYTITDIKKDDQEGYRIILKGEDGSRREISPAVANEMMGWKKPTKAMTFWDFARKNKVSMTAIQPYVGKEWNESHGEVVFKKKRKADKDLGLTETAFWESIPQGFKDAYNLDSPEKAMEMLADAQRAKGISLDVQEAAKAEEDVMDKRERQAADLEKSMKNNTVSIKARDLKIGDQLWLVDKNGRIDDYEVIDKDGENVVLEDGVKITRKVDSTIGNVAIDPTTGEAIRRPESEGNQDDIPFSRRAAAGANQKDMFESNLLDQIEENELAEQKEKPKPAEQIDMFGRKAGEQAVSEERMRREQVEKELSLKDQGLEGTAIKEQESDEIARQQQLSLFLKKGDKYGEYGTDGTGGLDFDSAGATEAEKELVRGLVYGLINYNGLDIAKDDISALGPSKDGKKVASIIRQAVGKKVVFIRLSQNFKSVFKDKLNGVTFRGTIFIAEDSNDPFFFVASHEAIHTIRRDFPDLFRIYIDTQIANMTPEGVEAVNRRRLLDKFPDTEAGRRKAHEEIAGDLASDNLSRPEFVNSLWNKSPELVRKLFLSLYRAYKRVARMVPLLRAKPKWFKDYNRQVEELLELLNRVMIRKHYGKDISAEIEDSAPVFMHPVAGEGQMSLFEQPKETTPEPVSQLKESDPTKVAAEETEEGIKDFGEKIGGARKDTAEKARPRTKIEKVAPTMEAWRARYIVMESIRNPGTFSIMDKRTQGVIRSGYKEQSFSSEAEAEAAIPLVAVARNHRPVMTRGSGENPKYEIRRITGDHKSIKVVNREFDSSEDAMKYIATHAVEIIETKTSFGEEILPTPEKVYRTGIERRTGPATAKMFSDTFGFRGVEFGNWNNQAERQEVMNHAFDGLLDLADAIEIPPLAISLNGELGLAFGARGQGLVGAKAHYEADYAVINLTKIKGAGSLAHEWMHAMDNYFARQDAMAPKEKTKNTLGDMVYKQPSIQRAFLSYGHSYKSQVRKEVLAAYKELVETMYRKAEGYVEDSKKAEEFLGRARDELKKELGKIRADLEKDLSKEYTWRKVKRGLLAASDEQLAEFDRLSNSLIEGGDLKTEWFSTKDRGLQGRYSNATLEAISKILKDVRGRNGFSTDKKGVLDGIRYDMLRYLERINLFNDAQAGSEKTKKVPTSYVIEAKKLDQGRRSDYWGEPHEMIARAFASYVEDKIAERQAQSDFLVYYAHGAIPNPIGLEFVARPYPDGEERIAVNKAFDRFFDVVETKETKDGVALFSRRDPGDFDQPSEGSFKESDYRPAVVSWAKEKWGEAVAPNSRPVWENFTKWFGDSKVVDADGKPLVVYHATNMDFTKFEKGAIGSRFPFSFGFHFTDRKQEVNEYARGFGKESAEGFRVIPTFLKAKNPLIIKTSEPAASMEADLNKAEIIREIVESRQGEDPYDSVIIERIRGDEFDGINVIIFEPSQIKSASANKGDFSAEQEDIRYLKSQLSKAEETARQEVLEIVNALDVKTDSERPVANDAEALEVTSKISLPPKVDAAQKAFIAERARYLERAERKARRQLSNSPESWIKQRANIEADINFFKELKLEEIRAKIYQYARTLKLNAEKYNYVDSMLKNVKSSKGLLYALDRMDNIINKRTNWKLKNLVEDTIAKERKRLGTQKPSDVDYKANKRLQEYMDEITVETPQKRAEAERLIQSLEDDPNLEMSDTAMGALKVVGRLSIHEMNNQELANVIRDIREIKLNGRLKHEADQAAFFDSVDKLAREVAPAISGGEKHFTESEQMKAYLARVRGKVEKRGKLAQSAKKFLWAQMRAENILEWFNGWKRGPLLKATYDKMRKATEKESVMFKKDLAKFEEIHKGLEIAKDMSKKAIDVTVDITDPEGNTESFSEQFAMDEAMFIYAHSQNPNSYNHLTAKIDEGGEGLHPLVIESIIEKMPESAKGAVDAMIDYYDTDVYDRLNESYRELIGMDLPKEHRYFPIMRLNTDRAENAMAMDFLMRNSSRMTGPEKGMTKKRVKSAAAFDRMSYYETVIESLKATNHMAAFGVPIKEINAVLNHPEIKKAMTDRNEMAFSELIAWVKRNGYGKISQPGGAIAGLAESLRLSYVPSVLGGNLMTMLKQGTSLAMGMDMLDKKTKSMSYALAQWGKNPKKMTREINEKSIFMADRRDSFQREFEEMAEKRFKAKILGASSLKDKSNDYLDRFKQFSMEGIKTIDSVTVNLLWTARHYEVFQKTGNEEAAIEQADLLIRKTQGTGGVLNLPSSFTGNALERMYTMFQNEQNQALQRMFEMASRWGEEKTTKNASKIFWRIALPSAIFYSMNHAFRWPWDDPEGWTKEAVRQTIGGIPIFGQMVLGIVDFGLGQIQESRGLKYRRDRFMADMTPTAFAILEDVMSVASNPNLSRTLELAAKLKGLPVIAFRRTKKAIDVGDWRYAVHSKMAMRDPGIFQAMYERKMKPRPKSDDKKVYFKWYRELPDKKREDFNEFLKEKRRESNDRR